MYVSDTRRVIYHICMCYDTREWSVMYVCVRYKESGRSCMCVLNTREWSVMYVCVKYKRVIGHVCMCQIQESDRSCMHVSDTRRVIYHICMCYDTREWSVMYVCVRYKESGRSCMYVLNTREWSVMYVCVKYKMVIGHVCMC